MVRRTDIKRDTKPLSPVLFKNPKEKEELEARNGLLQFDEVIRLVDKANRTGDFKLNLTTIQDLHRIAIQDIYTCAGEIRKDPVKINGTSHEPPPADEIPKFLEEMLKYANDHWDTASPIHIAAYLMWRINWIHPFMGGNGRTARAVSYLALCAKLGYRLPGENTIPEQIEANHAPYYGALDSADEAYKNGKIDVSLMEMFLTNLFLVQLKETYQKAIGKK